MCYTFIKKHVALDKAPFYCNICDFVCTNKRELTRHKERYPLHQHRVNEWKAQGKVFDEDSKLVTNPTSNYQTFPHHVPVPTYQPVPISTVLPSTTAVFQPPSMPDFPTATSTVVSDKSGCSTPNIGEDNILQQILHDDNDDDAFSLFDDDAMTFLNSPEDASTNSTISTTLPPTMVTANNTSTTASTASTNNHLR